MYDRNSSSLNLSTYALMADSLKDPKRGRRASRGQGPGPLPEPTWKSYPRGDERRRGRVTGSDDTIQNFQPRATAPANVKGKKQPAAKK